MVSSGFCPKIVALIWFSISVNFWLAWVGLFWINSLAWVNWSNKGVNWDLVSLSIESLLINDVNRFALLSKLYESGILVAWSNLCLNSSCFLSLITASNNFLLTAEILSFCLTVCLLFSFCANAKTSLIVVCVLFDESSVEVVSSEFDELLLKSTLFKASTITFLSSGFLSFRWKIMSAICFNFWVSSKTFWDFSLFCKVKLLIFSSVFNWLIWFFKSFIFWS
ncbi:hypothetical protein NWQ34_06300 [Mycoplasmopsis felis]|uniref:hypothetical protein n=1 Tax=Mycoplasmopsis felis TaxID=33923 RepID=UPI0021E08EAC|nr:hypothetical protein [Mycoplasmopsis felis]MCU9939147.1 hypothetical protein [Mycoplasmopsis felis]